MTVTGILLRVLLLSFERGVRVDDAEVVTGVGTHRHLGGDRGGVTSLSSTSTLDCSVDWSVLLTVGVPSTAGWRSTLGAEKENEDDG